MFYLRKNDIEFQNSYFSIDDWAVCQPLSGFEVVEELKNKLRDYLLSL